jgi:hypothetical protein
MAISLLDSERVAVRHLAPKSDMQGYVMSDMSDWPESYTAAPRVLHPVLWTVVMQGPCVPILPFPTVSAILNR